MPADTSSAGLTRNAETTLRLRRLLVDLERRVADAMRVNLEPAGLTVEDWAVLCLLSDGAGHTMTEVTTAAGVPAASATRLVDKLVSNALVHRTVDVRDGRRVLTVLSPGGAKLHGQLGSGQQQIARLLAAGIGQDALTSLMSALSAADTALEAHAGSAEHTAGSLMGT